MVLLLVQYGCRSNSNGNCAVSTTLVCARWHTAIMTLTRRAKLLRCCHCRRAIYRYENRSGCPSANLRHTPNVDFDNGRHQWPSGTSFLTGDTSATIGFDKGATGCLLVFRNQEFQFVQLAIYILPNDLEKIRTRYKHTMLHGKSAHIIQYLIASLFTATRRPLTASSFPAR